MCCNRICSQYLLSIKQLQCAIEFYESKPNFYGCDTAITLPQHHCDTSLMCLFVSLKHSEMKALILLSSWMGAHFGSLVLVGALKCQELALSDFVSQN